MKKADFIRVISDKASVSKNDAEKVLQASLETIQEILINGDSITFMGFGTFDTIERGAREAILPNSKEKIHVPARRSVKFRVGKNLKDAVAGKTEKKTEAKKETRTISKKATKRTTKSRSRKTAKK